MRAGVVGGMDIEFAPCDKGGGTVTQWPLCDTAGCKLSWAAYLRALARHRVPATNKRQRPNRGLRGASMYGALEVRR